MAAQPQPPQQPIYPNEFNLTLDRLYTRLIGYVDGQIEKLVVQARLNNQESIIRDNDALRRDLDLAQLIQQYNQESIKRDQDLANGLLAFREESKKQTEAILQLVRDFHTEARDAHAEAMEAINELRQAVNELRRKDKE